MATRLDKIHLVTLYKKNILSNSHSFTGSILQKLELFLNELQEPKVLSSKECLSPISQKAREDIRQPILENVVLRLNLK